MKQNQLVLSAVAVLIFSFVILGVANAESYVIEDNTAGSQNSVNINQNNSQSIFQGNEAIFNNNNSANADTGGNTTDGGTVITGDATAESNTENRANLNNAYVNPCCSPTPTKKPSADGKKTPTPTPTTKPGNGKDGDGDGDGDGNGNGGGNGGVGGGAIMGISAASSDINSVLSLAGVICVLSGMGLSKIGKRS
ncbi:hypothetical protein A2154_02865 [Candidatus Gottesmanbacteria bacterium RBG_16_43_7]|uniref:Uncharacterized protein n=1 Tax=Candidatus Gottesmanbacteria bacterium RBG_16_43_7 TaxID=1798373 RepID=A0A1F5Z9I7_9BACT|nr:MAG: hypothetical protein A2154_02865 [Candidatus Gottesmanbacteria bacterium RBG_16_43_7]